MTGVQGRSPRPGPGAYTIPSQVFKSHIFQDGGSFTFGASQRPTTLAKVAF